MLYKVSEVTREFGVTVRALRFYEERGLLKPVRVGTHRRYTTDDSHCIDFERQTRHSI